MLILFLFQMYMSNCSLQLQEHRKVDPQAIGVVEFYSIASAIKAADAAAKAAQVTLIEVRTGYAVGGKGYFTLTGDVGAVRAAVAAAEKQSELYIGSTVIPRPSKQVLESLLIILTVGKDNNRRERLYVSGISF